MPDGFVDFIITSPPYDNIRSYNGYQFEFEKIAIEIKRILKRGGVMIWVVGDKTEMEVRQAPVSNKHYISKALD